MSNLIRVCATCYRPVSSSYFIFRIGCTCPKHGRIDVEDTVKVPTEKAKYDIDRLNKLQGE